MIVAAVDCGTNSIRLLVAERDPRTGLVTELARRSRIVRLGQDVGRTGRLAPEALGRTFAACEEFAEVIDALKVEQLAFVATSATRDVADRAGFFAGVERILGVVPQVISGDEEARLSYAGAVRSLPTGSGPRLVLDIGGGSTELVVGAGEVTAAVSLDIGSVRLTERHLADTEGSVDRITDGGVAAVRRDVETALGEGLARLPLESRPVLVGVGGSVTTLAAIHRATRQGVHGSRLGIDDVRAVSSHLLEGSRADRAAIEVIEPGRVDVISAGGLILLTVMERLGTPEVIVSTRGLLDGLVRRLVGRSVPTPSGL
ncbi:Ppx/GppA phosphatase family protein [Streptacidiphilus sp. P02-A3a]|uniref:Ppx/GppA phosphatase family protein n=1 Tax=Streptacidiphilus sp. P02-A3a TaxID=2704468 RepID=UPI0015FC8254|nr:Ppx/GppA phosphatase family protein [Streptacidiphilus sp. P02-A3a]QMU71830.1 Ppx/GppA family phosphatase [Streptacidiphilus sp. P02-A3a]